MRPRTKILLTAVAAAATLAIAVGNATANRLSTNSLDVYVIWDALIFGPAIGEDVSCHVTLLGSFHSRTIRKVAAALIGSVTHARVETCQEGSNVTVLDETLPWHMTYQSFTGTLPNIARATFQLRGASFEIDNGTICRLRTTAGEPGRGISTLTSGTVSTLAAEGSIDLEPGDSICDFLSANGTLDGDASVSDDTDGSGSIIITLI
jgi:hypothetical protein